MERARLGRWHTKISVSIFFGKFRRNGKSPFRALTPFKNDFSLIWSYCVEMERARLGRWHPYLLIIQTNLYIRRNGKSPFRALKFNRNTQNTKTVECLILFIQPHWYADYGRDVLLLLSLLAELLLKWHDNSSKKCMNWKFAAIFAIFSRYELDCSSISEYNEAVRKEHIG